VIIFATMALVNTNAIGGIDCDLLRPRGSGYEGTALLAAAPKSLPKGFPCFLPTDLAWKGFDLGVCDESNFTYHLTECDILELNAALEVFNASGIHGHCTNSDNFPLPNFSKALEALRDEVHHGKGFFLVRGLDLNLYTVENAFIIFLGIQSYIAEQRASQDSRGNMVVHIISDSPPLSSPTRSLHSRHSTSSISFHNEETSDIIAWQTRGTATCGGSCILTSAYTIYNILAATRPDIICTLSKSDWPFALPHFHNRPILFYHDSHLIINFSRTSLLGSPAHPRPASLPTLTSTQREALDVLEAIAVAYQVKFTTQPGDMHFVNNLALLHRREEFVDDHDDAAAGADASKGFGTGLGRKRHLVRMRLRNQKMGWEIPDALKGEWEDAFREEGERVWHVEPMPEGFFPLRKYSL